MTAFHILASFNSPVLHVWRDRATQNNAQLAFDVASSGIDDRGLHTFSASLDQQLHSNVHMLLHQGDSWEFAGHRKTLPRGAQYRFPKEVWCAQGAARVVAQDPFAIAHAQVRIHLVTITKYRDGELLIWSPGEPDLRVRAAGEDELGPYFDVRLEGRHRHLFLFKFVAASGETEPVSANRLWTAHDGTEIWVHSEQPVISLQKPVTAMLVVHYLASSRDSIQNTRLHLWQENCAFETTLAGVLQTNGWLRFEQAVYSELPYKFLFKNSSLQPIWEHVEATRNVFLREDAAWTVDGDGSERKLGRTGAWTLEGDHELFGRLPAASKNVAVEIGAAAPAAAMAGEITLDVWINHARSPLIAALRANANGRWTFKTYPEVVVSFRFRAGHDVEPVERHTLKIARAETRTTRKYVVLGRADPVQLKPVSNLFLDPPFSIDRPGAWIAGDKVRFALHCSTASTVELVGEWTDWRSAPIAMHSTRDGTYWWLEIPRASITSALGRPNIHGVLYKFLLNQARLVQDPAADWVENSDPEKASRLVDHRLYHWRSDAWTRPGWEYLTIYQLHPTRFSQRAGTNGLAGVTRELTDPNGYLRSMNATAILLMPICEFAGNEGWGYNPSYFYAVESSYGGPDALKAFVDAAHECGKAVLLDVVFNHAGASDNVLWSVANESYFDGDTDWGAMINFDHPQVIHFFEQNLVHFMRHYRIDGFRFDFTRVIRFGHEWTYHVKRPGSGGGWNFMKRLQAAVHAVDGRCLMMAENYPNDWDLTRTHGPMDTQWGDNFHDRLVDAARGWDVMGPLAEAMTLTHIECERWHEATHFPESHDEVGNVANRIVNVAGFGQGLRRNKVAAAAALFCRGIPLWFMGAESGEWRQFMQNTNDTLNLDAYEQDTAATRVRAWWNKLCELRRGNNRIEGPAPIRVHYAQDSMLAFSRGDNAEWFVVLNFGHHAGERSLAVLNLPDGEYKEVLNSTWGDYRVEAEDEHSNGGWDARLRREYNLNMPDYGVVILERR